MVGEPIDVDGHGKAGGLRKLRKQVVVPQDILAMFLSESLILALQGGHASLELVVICPWGLVIALHPTLAVLPLCDMRYTSLWWSDTWVARKADSRAR